MTKREEPDEVADKEESKLKFDFSQSNTDTGMKIFSYLLAGIVCYGGIGWLLDKAFGTSWLVMVGIVFGMTASLYVIIRKFGSGS
uniref:AtpZ/AtpI family protein n=1 Tax=Vaginimicrobium propionicum TaxID=1871034 RepID=UPI001E337A10|nr:AtpZ/AtpI family protein [Vaginimicrobium propionicum]